MKNFKKLLAVALSAALLASTLLSGGLVVYAAAATYQIADLEGKYKTQGRTEIENGALMLDWTAAGIEWNANCSGDVSITVNATRMGHTDVNEDGVLDIRDLVALKKYFARVVKKRFGCTPRALREYSG